MLDFALILDDILPLVVFLFRHRLQSVSQKWVTDSLLFLIVWESCVVVTQKCVSVKEAEPEMNTFSRYFTLIRDRKSDRKTDGRQSSGKLVWEIKVLGFNLPPCSPYIFLSSPCFHPGLHDLRDDDGCLTTRIFRDDITRYTKLLRQVSPSKDYSSLSGHQVQNWNNERVGGMKVKQQVSLSTDNDDDVTRGLEIQLWLVDKKVKSNIWLLSSCYIFIIIFFLRHI